MDLRGKSYVGLKLQTFAYFVYNASCAVSRCLGRFLLSVFVDDQMISVDILRDLRWDSLEQRRSKQLAISVFKSLNNLYPESLKNVFKPTSGVHSYNVRGASNNVFVPRPRTEAAKRAFSYRGAVMWNGLENMLKDEVNLNSFKSALSF